MMADEPFGDDALTPARPAGATGRRAADARVASTPLQEQAASAAQRPGSAQGQRRSGAEAVTADTTSWDARIRQYVMADGSVRVPPRIAQILDERVAMLSEQRKLLRASDAEAYAVLCALHLSSLGHEQNVFSTPQMSGSGHDLDSGTTQRTESEQLTTPQAAARLGRTDRTVRRWCETKRLPARWHGGRWHINEHDLRVAQAATAA